MQVAAVHLRLSLKRRRFGAVKMAGKAVMHAVQYDSYGGGVAGLKHVEVPVPTPNKDEALLKVEAASINPIDWKLQKGMLRPFLPRKFPFIPVLVAMDVLFSAAVSLVLMGLVQTNSSDVAGEVIGLGSEVKNFKVGDKVVAVLSGGGLAEFAVAKESLTVARPQEVSAAEGAGIPCAGLSAHQALTQSLGVKLDGSGQQKNILITAASGAVGLYAVQLAKLGNTHVTATCGARNIELVKSLGADEVLDYKTPDGAALKSPSGRKYDAVINCVTGIPWSTFEPNLGTTGKVIDFNPSPRVLLTFAWKKLTFSKKQLVPFSVSPKGENLDFLVKLVKEGKLKTVIDSKHSLSKAEDAWAKRQRLGSDVVVFHFAIFFQPDTVIYIHCAEQMIDGLVGKHVHVPVPTPRKDEVLLKVEASSLNAFDWKIKKGVARPILPRKFPYIPGKFGLLLNFVDWNLLITDVLLECILICVVLTCVGHFSVSPPVRKCFVRTATDVAGEIIEVGSEVKNFKAGYNVVAILNHFSGGGLAEFAMVKESLTASRPLEVSAAEGAGLPLAGLTALEALTQSAGVNLDGSGQQKNILITAASGGADEVLDYKTPDGAALKSPSGRKYDAVIQCATGIPWSTFEPNLAKNGKVIDLTPGPSAMLTFAWQKLTFSKKQLVPLLVIPKGENLVFLVKLLKEGKIKTLIDSKHLLGKAEDAWGKSADGHATGKIILEP
ncbi:hypothetical protein WN944_016494 [Citrus x changshan-huyou]|uniref:Enoyl reductase (ER) domain-containing protein n=1 Tax=Citrus x changshan-huyou TaxID=2935761 RepID=A0AAP0M9F9_9ROSI